MANSASRIRLSLASAVLAAGCFGADLRKVHLPDLLTVDAKTAQRARPGPPPAGKVFLESKPVIWRHASLEPVEAIFDGDDATAATARHPESKDQYILIDLGCMTKVTSVRQFHGDSNGYPCRYRIDTAGEHNFPYEAAFVGPGSADESVACFRKPRKCRFLRITLLEPGPSPWTVTELTVH